MTAEHQAGSGAVRPFKWAAANLFSRLLLECQREPCLSTARKKYRRYLFLKYVFDYQRKREPLFVLCTPRTGSNLLLSYLDSLPDASFGLPFRDNYLATEPLHPEQFFGLEWKKDRSRTGKHLKRTLNSLEHSFCGFKILHNQMARHGITFCDLAEAFPRARFIMLYREALGEQALSHAILCKTRLMGWNPEYKEPETFSLHRRTLLGFFQIVLQAYRDLINFPSKYSDRILWLSYESVASRPQEIFKDLICPFTRRPYFPVRTAFKKMQLQPHSLLLSNYAEIKDLLEIKVDLETFRAFAAAPFPKSRVELEAALTRSAVQRPQGAGRLGF